MPQLATRTWGDGPLALLVHGVTSSSRTWWRVGPALAGRGYLVVLPNYFGTLDTDPKNGTPDELGELFLMEMSGFEEAFLERLIYARNRDWIAPIKGMLASNEENLVIVGAAHLIGGDSVLDLLQAAGYSIERIQ